MSRQERRAQEKIKEKAQSKTTPAIKAAQLKQQGMVLKAEGKEQEAIFPLTEALKLDSSLADVHFTLAMMADTKPHLKIDMDKINKSISNKKVMLNSYSSIMTILRSKKQYKEAVICQDQICRLFPDDPFELMDLGLLLNRIGKNERAIVTMSKALNMAPDSKLIKGTYSSSIFRPVFTAFYPEVKQAILECFKNIYDADLQRVSLPWVNLMIKDPSFEALKNARMIADKDEFKIWADGLNEETGAFLRDPYFTEGLRLLIVADTLVEAVLVQLRRYICINLDSLVASQRIHLFEKFLYALAEQCFFNEYIYAESNVETDIVSSLKSRNDKIAIGLIGCYRPLYRAMPDKADILRGFAKDDIDFSKLVKTQFDDPLEEERLKETLPEFGKSSNEVSRAVQDQYEENPYPRWITMYSIPLPHDDMIFEEKSRNLPYKILIAGCGTGRHAIGTAARHPNAKITAIDLSRASLAYGLRKAKECGVSDRINFVHADILSMKDWPEQFDIVECSGVLHHMEDPFLGWKTLNEKLKTNGCFKVGLYSESARQPVVQARSLIAAKGYPPTIEGIRTCRNDIMAMRADDPMRQYFLSSRDFYTTSLLRDFIFHVQEHRMTLNQIKGMMDELGLISIKFIPTDPDMAMKYDQMFPEDPARSKIENWEIYEQKYPKAFVGMYQFWCQKTKADVL